MGNHTNSHLYKVTLGGLLVTLGIIYGDIGTSPLYVMKAIIGVSEKDFIAENVVLGAISCIFWTLTLQTTIKYVLLTLRADNKGEGGIFALYTLVRRTKVKWLLILAIIGGSALLADGIITPPISVASAVEGLRIFNADIPTVPIVIGILTLLFFIQQFGTNFIGKFFGPMMFIWFAMLGILGIMWIGGNVGVLKAVNPIYAYHLLSEHPGGLLVLGSVFLCTTGAEALYSDLGHCGRNNIRVSWIFVKIMLLLNYFGQGAYLIAHKGQTLVELSGDPANPGNPFYLVMPTWFQGTGIVISTLAAIIASQALISGSYTLISEAMRLNLWPKVKIKYPTEARGQLYIPSINWLLLTGCIFVVWHFKESSEMEAAYGLAIILCMLMTTILLFFFLRLTRFPIILTYLIAIVYLVIESGFLYANLSKFSHGGYITLMIASVLAFVMIVWYYAKQIRRHYTEFGKIERYKDAICELSKDESIPKYATHLVYLSASNDAELVENKIIYSIMQKRPKRADIYWLINVHVDDDPHRSDYIVTEIAKDDIVRVDFFLGFKVQPKINMMFRQVVQDMVKRNEIDITSRYESLNRNNVIGDFKFIVLEKFLSVENKLPWYEKITMDAYFFLRRFSLGEARAFGLDPSFVKIEKFPLILVPHRDIKLHRLGVPDEEKTS
ncbi:MAG: KUP/HAK/KT family potassium transporter [Bacteroidia bacterium]